MTGYFTRYINSVLEQLHAKTLKVHLVSSKYFPDIDEHGTLSDVPESAFIAEKVISSATIENGILRPTVEFVFPGLGDKAGELHGLLISVGGRDLVAYIGHEQIDRAFSARGQNGDLILNISECGLIGL